MACGKAPKDKSFSGPQAQTSEGNYSAIFMAINVNVSPSLEGKIYISRMGDFFEVQIKMKNLPSGEHHQYLQSGSNCPGVSADKNSDGYIDATEVQDSVGIRLVPLDSDLSKLGYSTDQFPAGSNYKYSQSTSYDLLLSDLNNEGELFFDGGIVVIYGAENMNLPSTVSSSDGLTPEKSLPLACAVLRRESSVNASSSSGWDNSTDDSESTHPPIRTRPIPREDMPEAPKPSEDETVKPSNGTWMGRVGRWVRGWFGRRGGGAENRPKPEYFQ